MKIASLLLLISVGFFWSGSADVVEAAVFDSTGMMNEVVVTAPRYEFEDDAWSGLMDTVVVSAPRIAPIASTYTRQNTTASPTTWFALFVLVLSVSSFGFMWLRHGYKKYNDIPELVCVRATCRS